MFITTTADINRITAVTNATMTTSTSGTAFITLSGGAVKEVTIFNFTGTTIDVRRGGAGVSVPLPTATIRTFDTLADASDLSVRRTDVSNTQVAVVYELRT